MSERLPKYTKKVWHINSKGQLEYQYTHSILGEQSQMILCADINSKNPDDLLQEIKNKVPSGDFVTFVLNDDYDI